MPMDVRASERACVCTCESGKGEKGRDVVLRDARERGGVGVRWCGVVWCSLTVEIT